MIPEVLQSKMQEEGYTTQSLAKKCGLPERWILSWLQGDTSYSWEHVMSLAAALNTSMDYLAGLTVVPDSYPGSSMDRCKEIIENSEKIEGDRVPPREHKKKNLPYPQNLFTYAGVQDLCAEPLSKDQAEALAYVLSTLAEEKQLIVRRYFQEDVKQNVIANEIGKSRAWVSSVVCHASYHVKRNRRIIEMGYAAYMEECETRRRREEAQQRYIEQHPDMTPIAQIQLPWVAERCFRKAGLLVVRDVADYIKADSEYYKKWKGYGPYTDAAVKDVLRRYGLELT